MSQGEYVEILVLALKDKRLFDVIEAIKYLKSRSRIKRMVIYTDSNFDYRDSVEEIAEEFKCAYISSNFLDEGASEERILSFLSGKPLLFSAMTLFIVSQASACVIANLVDPARRTEAKIPTDYVLRLT